MEKEIDYKREIEVPADVESSVENNEVRVKKAGKELRRRFPHIIVEKKDSKIMIRTRDSLRKDKKKINSVVAHINNMIAGLSKDYQYKLQICSVHFPMNVSVKDDFVIIKNFLGETRDRKAKILPHVQVKVNKEIIEVSSPNKEAAGQTAANIEKSAVVRNKDRRIFQDGIFMIEKSGEAI
jgi:large subunit ribosomal protein L6